MIFSTEELIEMNSDGFRTEDSDFDSLKVALDSNLSSSLNFSMAKG